MLKILPNRQLKKYVTTMFSAIVENAAKYLVAEPIRDEAIGDLWERDYDLMVSNASRFYRLLLIIWSFLLLIKASIDILLSDTISHFQSQTSLMDCTFDGDSQPSSDNLDTETTEVLKTYCSLRQHYNAKVSSRILWPRTLIKSSLVDKVEDILEECTPFRERGNSGDFIISRLKLSLLAKKLKGRGGKGQDPMALDCRYFRELLEEIQLPKSFLMQYVKFDSTKYKRTLVFRTRIPSLVSVYVISWEPGQFAPIHHHGNALDGIIVVDGNMTHALTPPKSYVPYESVCAGKKQEVDSEVYKEGDILIVPPCYCHQIENASEERLVTVHFRIGFLPHDEYWNEEQELPFIAWDDSSDRTEVLSARDLSLLENLSARGDEHNYEPYV